MAALAIEYLLLFFIGPTLFAYFRHRIPAIPTLWLLMVYCLYILLHDPRFHRENLWNTAGLRQYAPAILGVFAAAALSGIMLILNFAPGLFLSLPRTNPRFWALIMVLYPVLSVYPQGIVYRAFVFARYRDLFGPHWLMVLASAAAFAYAHIVFRNPLALILTLLGGLIFAIRYMQTGSVLVSSFEHALYGCAVFTIGIGRSFYHAAMRR